MVRESTPDVFKSGFRSTGTFADSLAEVALCSALSNLCPVYGTDLGLGVNNGQARIPADVSAIFRPAKKKT